MHPRHLLVLLACLLAFVAAHPFAGQAPAPQQSPAAAAQNGQQLVALADEVGKEVETLRGWTFKQPIKKELTTLPDTVAYLKRQVDESLPPGKAEVTQAFLRTIGLLPPTGELRTMWVALLENQVGGFYDTKSKSMHLVAREGTPPAVERIVLAHELTHALDDQWADLDTFVKEHTNETEDMGLAAQSVVEGSATALMMQYAAQLIVQKKMDPAALLGYAKQEEERSKPFLDAPRYFSAMLASYICGAQFLAKGQLMTIALGPSDKPIGDALLAARADPPQSSEQILHPDKYWKRETRDEPVKFDDRAATAWLAQPGRVVVHADTVGELLTAILTTAAGAKLNLMAAQTSDAWTNAAATGWGGDRFYLVASGTSVDNAKASLAGLKGVWVTAWDTTKDRDEFVTAVPGGSFAPGAAIAPVGSVVAVVYFGFAEAERATLTKGLQASPIPMTKGGKAFGSE
jgi:hypothetical protein